MEDLEIGKQLYKDLFIEGVHEEGEGIYYTDSLYVYPDGSIIEYKD